MIGAGESSFGRRSCAAFPRCSRSLRPSTSASAACRPTASKYASGLFNMMRNLGGAVGIAICGAILNDRTNFHFLAIASNLTPANGAMERFIDGAEQRYGAVLGRPTRTPPPSSRSGSFAYREASTLAYADAFRAIMIAFIAAALLVPLMRKVSVPAGPATNSH